MYAVIELNNNQYIVKKNEEIIVDKLSETDLKEIEIKNVLLLKDKDKLLLGKPYLNNVTVHADVVKDFLDKKVIIFRYRPKKDSKKKKGHRQPYTIIKIKDIIVT